MVSDDYDDDDDDDDEVFVLVSCAEARRSVIKASTHRDSGCLAFRTSAIKLRSVTISQLVRKLTHVVYSVEFK